jgi:translation initiation factor 2 beta subunit (eIF-2beta)/eIF-5
MRPLCPKCHSFDTQIIRESAVGEYTVECRICGKQFAYVDLVIEQARKLRASRPFMGSIENACNDGLD